MSRPPKIQIFVHRNQSAPNGRDRTEASSANRVSKAAALQHLVIARPAICRYAALNCWRYASKLMMAFVFWKGKMASEPKRPNDADNVVSLREARARQAAQAKAERNKPVDGATEKKMPALLIFLGLLAVVVAIKFLAG
jgi:hypothetical protein